jgi:hypothetical protein
VAKAGLLERRLAVRHDFWMREMLVLMLERVLSVVLRERKGGINQVDVMLSSSFPLERKRRRKSARHVFFFQIITPSGLPLPPRPPFPSFPTLRPPQKHPRQTNFHKVSMDWLSKSTTVSQQDQDAA